MGVARKVRMAWRLRFPWVEQSRTNKECVCGNATELCVSSFLCRGTLFSAETCAVFVLVLVEENTKESRKQEAKKTAS